jgi:hypothetical protein
MFVTTTRPKNSLKNLSHQRRRSGSKHYQSENTWDVALKNANVLTNLNFKNAKIKPKLVNYMQEECIPFD